MQNPHNHTPPLVGIPFRVKDLTKHIDVCKKFLDSSQVHSVSVLISGTRYGKKYHELLVWNAITAGPLPLQELTTFFQSYGDRCYAEKLQLQ